MVNCMQRRIVIKNLLAVASAAALSFTATFAHADGKQLKVGDDEAALTRKSGRWSRKLAAREGLNAESDRIQRLRAAECRIDAGDLDANGFQHQPFLDSQTGAARL